MQQIPQMTKAEATRVVTDAFEGRRRDDAVLAKALELCGIDHDNFVDIRGKVKAKERSLPRYCVLTPTGGQRRR